MGIDEFAKDLQLFGCVLEWTKRIKKYLASSSEGSENIEPFSQNAVAVMICGSLSSYWYIFRYLKKDRASICDLFRFPTKQVGKSAKVPRLDMLLRNQYTLKFVKNKSSEVGAIQIGTKHH